MPQENQVDDAVVLNTPRNGYKLLFISLLALWVVAPLARSFAMDQGFELVVLTLLILAGGYAISDEARRFRVIVVLGVLVAALVWIDYLPFIDVYPKLPSRIVGVAFFLFVAYEILTDILSKQSRVDMSLIYGALSVYLLIGVAFAWLYEAVFLVDSDAFKGVLPGEGDLVSFDYFSFVTLTTLGYGDISPATQVTGSLATLEALIGQVYLTVLVARLVGMQISQSPD